MLYRNALTSRAPSRSEKAWTAQRVARAIMLREGGYSASQIAADLGGVSRSAVIGKLCRLGLAGKGGAARKPRPVSAKPARRRHHNVTRLLSIIRADDPTFAEVVPVDDLAIPAAQRKSLLELGAGHCRWPIGHPGTPDFFFCGGAIEHGYSYCRGHLMRAIDIPRTFASRMVSPQSV
jgi:GcrA cell cycle regulator